MTTAAHPRPALSPSTAAVGGWALVAAAVAFVAVFSYLAATFGYPEVLDGTADAVLPRLLALGAAGRLVWAVYALLPLLLVPAALGARAALGDDAPRTMRVAAVLGGVAAVAMLVGLARWPTVHWGLAESWGAAGAAERQSIAATFDTLNTALGRVVGEFVGELALNLFFLLSAVASWRSRRVPRWSAPAGAAAAAFGLVALWRNVTPAVAAAAEVENYVLPLWMIVLGVLVARAARAPARA